MPVGYESGKYVALGGNTLIVIKVYRFYSLSSMVYHKSLQKCNSLDCCTVWKGMYKNQINECLKAASWV